MSMSGGYLGRRLASEWCIGSSRAAINIILPLLLLLYVLKKRTFLRFENKIF